MKKQFLIKIISIGALALVLASSPVNAPKSEAWLEFAGQAMANAYAQMRDTVNGIINGIQKQLATQMLNMEISLIVGGSSSQNSRIIGNYRDFLDIEPTQRTNIFMNDYLSQVTRGRGSASGYIPYAEGFGNGAFVGGLRNGNYIAQLRQSALSVTAERNDPHLTYVGNPRQNMFANGSMDNFNLYLSGINNPWAFNLNAEQKYQERLALERDASRTEAIAGGGIKSTRQGDTIITPGSLIGADLANVRNLGLNVIANAQSTPEIITSVVQNILTQSIQNGIGNAQRNVQREILNASSRSNTVLDIQFKNAGPGSIWRNPDDSAWKNPDLPQ